MILFHGTIYDFEEIDVNIGKGYKDFGRGFYTTANENHAIRLANRNRLIEIERFKKRKDSRVVESYIYTYELDLSVIDRFNVQRFERADVEWVRFVLGNRLNADRIHNYDIVIGPTADDDTATSFNAYRAGAYGDVDSKRALEMLIMNLEADNLSNQIYFGSNQSVSLLKRVGIKRL